MSGNFNYPCCPFKKGNLVRLLSDEKIWVVDDLTFSYAKNVWFAKIFIHPNYLTESVVYVTSLVDINILRPLNEVE
jgi:hypothetical protein